MKLQAEAVDMRTLGARDLRKTVDESTLAMNRKETYCIYRNTGCILRASQVCVNNLSMDQQFNVQSHCWTYTTSAIFYQISCPRTNNAKDGRQCFGNFYLKSREPINNSTKRRKGASRLCRREEIEQVHFS